jgi:hypothetical protein
VEGLIRKKKVEEEEGSSGEEGDKDERAELDLIQEGLQETDQLE